MTQRLRATSPRKANPYPIFRGMGNKGGKGSVRTHLKVATSLAVSRVLWSFLTPTIFYKPMFLYGS